MEGRRLCFTPPPPTYVSWSWSRRWRSFASDSSDVPGIFELTGQPCSPHLPKPLASVEWSPTPPILCPPSLRRRILKIEWWEGRTEALPDMVGTKAGQPALHRRPMAWSCTVTGVGRGGGKIFGIDRCALLELEMFVLGSPSSSAPPLPPLLQVAGHRASHQFQHH